MPQPSRTRRSLEEVLKALPWDKLLREGLPLDLIKSLLERRAQEALRNAGPSWMPAYDVKVVAGGREPIQLRHAAFKQIHVAVNGPELLKRCKSVSKRSNSITPLSPAEDSVYSVVRLWAGHYDHCPFDLWRHQRLCEAAARGAYGTAWVSSRQWTLSNAVTGLFEKEIVGRILTQKEPDRFPPGLVDEHVINGHPANLLAQLFFRVQSLLAPGAWEAHLQRRGISLDPLAESLLPHVLRVVFGGRARRTRDRWRLRNVPRYHRRYWHWPEQVAGLARLLIPYLEGESSSAQQVFGASRPNDSPQHGPHGPGGREGEPPDAQAQEILAQVANPFTSQAGDDQSASSESQQVPAAGIGGGMPIDCRSLDDYYGRRATEVVVQAEGHEQKPAKEPEMLSIGFMDAQPADLLSLATEQISWFRTRVRRRDHGKELCLFKQAEPLTIPARDDEPGEARVPHLLLVVDSSSSMGFNPQATDVRQRRKYDLVLTACYGMFNHIERKRLGADLQVACINFSSKSIASGWHEFGNMQPAKDVLLTYQGGGTTLAPHAIRQTFESRPGPFLAVVITDGCISNARSAAAELKKVVRAGCDLVLLHVGGSNDFTKAVQEMRCPVHIVKSAKDLVGLTLSIAREEYQ